MSKLKLSKEVERLVEAFSNTMMVSGNIQDLVERKREGINQILEAQIRHDLKLALEATDDGCIKDSIEEEILSQILPDEPKKQICHCCKQEVRA